MDESKKDIVISVKGGQKVLLVPDLEAAVGPIKEAAEKIVAAMQSAGEAIVGLKTTIKGQAAEIKSGFDSIKSDAESMAKSVDASVKKAASSRAKAAKAPAVPQEPSEQSVAKKYEPRGTTKNVPRVFTGSSIPVAPSLPPPVRHDIKNFGLPEGRPPYVQKLGRHSMAANDRAKEQIARDIELSRRVANFGGPDIETLRKPLGRSRLNELRKFQVGDTDVFDSLRQETPTPAAVPKKTKAQSADEKFEKEVTKARRAWREALNQQNSRYFDQMYQEPVSPQMSSNFGGPDIETLRKPLGRSRLNELRKFQVGDTDVFDSLRQETPTPAAVPKKTKAQSADEKFEKEVTKARRAWREALNQQNSRYFDQMYQEPVSPQMSSNFGGPDIETLRKPLSSHQVPPRPSMKGATTRYSTTGKSIPVIPTTPPPAAPLQHGPAAPTAAQQARINSANVPPLPPSVVRQQQVGKAAQQLATGQGLYGTSRDLMPTELHEAYGEAEKILEARKVQLSAIKSSATASNRQKVIADEELRVVEARLKMNKAQSAGLKEKWSKRIMAEGKLAEALLKEQQSPSVKNSFAVQAARKEFQQANRDYEAARNPHASDKGVGGQNLTFAAGQLAYGVEDFFQVLAAGQSPMRAFLGAANNIGPALGLLGISATTASMGVAGLLAASALFAHSGARTKREVEDIRKQIDLLSNSMEKIENLRFTLADAIGEVASGRGSVSRLADDLRAVGNELRAVNAIVVKGRSLSREAHKNSFPDMEMRARLNPGARRAEEFRESWSERASEFKTHWVRNLEAFGLIQNRPMEKTGDRFQGPRSLSQMKAENQDLQANGASERLSGGGAALGAYMGAPGGPLVMAVSAAAHYAVGYVVGEMIDATSGKGLADESAVNRHIDFNLEKHKSEQELGVYKELAALLANLDEQLAKRKAILERALSKKNAFMESYGAASGFESEFGVVGMRGDLARRIPQQRVANRQAVIEADERQSLLPQYDRERKRIKEEIKSYDREALIAKHMASGKFTERKGAEVAAQSDIETNMPRLTGQLEAVEKQIQLIKEGPEAARKIEAKQNREFDEALKTAGAGLLAFDGMMKGVVDAEIIRNEELRPAMHGINQEVAKMADSDQKIIKAAMAFDAIERKFNSSVQASVRSARGGRQESAIFGLLDDSQKTGRELNSQDAIKTLEEERDLAISRARARHANNPEKMKQEIENRRTEFGRKIKAEEIRGSGHEFSMVTLDKQLSDLEKAIKGAIRGVGDPKIIGRMKEQAAQQKQTIIESDPLMRLKNDLDGFSMVVATAASETERLTNANKAQNGKLSDLTLATMDATSFLKKMGFEVERLPDTLKKMDERAKAAMKSIDERNLPADVKSRMKEDVRLQAEAGKARAEFSDIANAGSREARGGFAERGVFSTPQGRKTGKMLNFEAAVKTAREELEVGNKEIRAKGGPNAEKAIADRQMSFQRRVAEMMGQTFGLNEKKPAKMIQGENLWQTIQESINQDPSVEIEKSQLSVLENIYNVLSGSDKAKKLTAGEQKMAEGILAGNVPSSVVSGNAAGSRRGGFKITAEQQNNREKERMRQKEVASAGMKDEEAKVEAAMAVPEDERTPEQNATINSWEQKQEDSRLREKSNREMLDELGPRGDSANGNFMKKKPGPFGEGASMALPAGEDVGISLRDGIDQSKLLGDILKTLDNRLGSILGAQMQTVGAINNAEGGLI